jgi:hypothetical protein
MLVNSGRDLFARVMGGDVAGLSGTATATSATSLTGTGTPFVLNALIGHVVVAWTTGVYGVVVSNTTSALTIDQWYTPNSPGGAAAATPSATTGFTVLPGGAPSWYMALTADVGAPAASDATLPGEITAGGGGNTGLVRKIASYAHTTGLAPYTLAVTFTASGATGLPVTLHKIGILPCLPAVGPLTFETVLSADATLSASGDAVTITETVTGS